jgi:hypothetical protein
MINTLLGLGLALALLAPTAVRAAPISLFFTGVIDSVFDPTGALDGSVASGTPFTGRYTFESTAPDDDSFARLGIYDSTGAPYGMSVEIGSYSFWSNPVSGTVGIEVSDSRPYDGYQVSTSIDVLSSDPSLGLVSFGFQFDDLGFDPAERGDVWSSDALPLGAPGLSQFGPAFFTVGMEIGTILGRVTSLTAVPEATTASLVAVGLAGIACSRRR